jgi:hypothetical protein
MSPPPPPDDPPPQLKSMLMLGAGSGSGGEYLTGSGSGSGRRYTGAGGRRSGHVHRLGDDDHRGGLVVVMVHDLRGRRRGRRAARLLDEGRQLLADGRVDVGAVPHGALGRARRGPRDGGAPPPRAHAAGCRRSSSSRSRDFARSQSPPTSRATPIRPKTEAAACPRAPPPGSGARRARTACGGGADWTRSWCISMPVIADELQERGAVRAGLQVGQRAVAHGRPSSYAVS